MTTLELRVVANNVSVGSVTYVDGKLTYEGVAEQVFAELERRLGPQALGENLVADGWSNGYLAIDREAKGRVAASAAGLMTWHLAGQHDQKAHGHHQAVTDRVTLAGGALADTELVTFADGSRAVHKTYQDYFTSTGRLAVTGKKQIDAEYLAGRVGEATGARVPRVERLNDSEVYMDYVDGETAWAGLTHVEENQMYKSDDGKRLGLLDLVMGNADRHGANWMVNRDGKLVGIDHGAGWNEQGLDDWRRGNDRPFGAFTSPFAKNWVTAHGYKNPGMSRTELTEIRKKMVGLRGEFDSLGRGEWLDFALHRLDQVIAVTP